MAEQTYITNADGSVTIKMEGKDTKFVKESDLLTVKGASEQVRKEYEDKVTKYQTDLAEANRKHDELHQTLLQKDAALEQLQTKAEEHDTLTTKVGELQSQLSAADENRRKTEEELLGIKRSTFSTTYKVDPEKVKEMSLDQLREAEKNFNLVGFQSNPNQPARYDGGGGGSGATTPLSPIEQAKAEIAVARELQSKKMAGGNYNPNNE